jgi:hypothetical protein
VSTEQSLYPQFFKDLNAIDEFTREDSFRRISSRNGALRCSTPKIYDIIRDIFKNRDYHLIVRTKFGMFVEQLEDACRYAFMPMIELCLKYGHANIIKGIEGACRSGDLSVVKMLFNSHNVLECYLSPKGCGNPITFEDCWSYLYYCAGYGGNVDVVDFIRDYGLSNNIRDRLKECLNEELNEDITANCVLVGACNGGHLELVKWAVEKGSVDFDEGFADACEKGHLHIIEYLLSLDDFAAFVGNDDIDQGLYDIFRKGFSDIAKCVIEWCQKMNIVHELNWSFFLQGACEGKHQHLINLAVKHGATECNCCHKSVRSHIKEIE